ncbi:hypothetical protein [Bacillus coahuilensis]|nr:hypothetical protein [Bacillus coahuilensis]
MQNNQTESIYETLKNEEQKRDAFLNQFVAVMLSSIDETAKEAEKTEA